MSTLFLRNSEGRLKRSGHGGRLDQEGPAGAQEQRGPWPSKRHTRPHPAEAGQVWVWYHLGIVFIFNNDAILIDNKCTFFSKFVGSPPDERFQF